MQFLIRPPGQPARLGILPGSFNPPTRAHIALAEAALAEVDEVVLVLPSAFPHKTYDGASFAQRADMLRAVLNHRPRLNAATSVGGLFIEIAQECRAAYGPNVQLTFVCGRDAAERIVNWDYGNSNVVSEMLKTFQLLVASREGTYEPPPHLRRYIRKLALCVEFDTISASEVRRRIGEGQDWQHLVPEEIVPVLSEMREVYRPPA